jgi:GNAT superfamily N-acetyltransferase
LTATTHHHNDHPRRHRHDHEPGPINLANGWSHQAGERHPTAEDAAFLQQMLTAAANWRPGRPPRSLTEVLAEPALAHYIDSWPREGDFGLIAEEGPRLGAAWWRFFSSDDPGYGFVNEATPELSIAVVAGARGCGLGSLLLDALVHEARQRDLTALSLSVEPDNPARSLYERAGFATAARMGGSLTMVLNLIA